MQVSSLSKLYTVIAQLCDESIVITCLLGVFLAAALANRNQNGQKNFKKHHGENSHHSFIDIGVKTDLQEGSETWKSVWDVKTGYIATKLISRHSCIIAKMDERLLLGKQFPAPPQGVKGPGPDQLPPIENHFRVSKNRLQSLHPYGKRIQVLCRGIPSYLAYPAAGEYTSNSGLHTKIKMNKVTNNNRKDSSEDKQIVTTVLLGLLLTPTLAQEFQNKGRNQQVITKEIHVAGGYEILTINTQWRVAIIEGRSSQGLWKTILNYDRGFIATKVEAKNACLISVMNRQEMPEFDALPRLAEEAANLESQGQPTKEIVFEVIRRPVGDLQSYGQDTFTMCQGLTTYMASEVEGSTKSVKA
nr:PREDICTED: gastrokine-1 [Opisthocomus hoazin]